jgi:MoaA/NifB/PqqE/SkfB family radical SAM enzyme
MGWACCDCGNKEQFIELNKVRTYVSQEPDTKIRKIVNSYENDPLIEVRCGRCSGTNVSWTHTNQKSGYQFDDDMFVSENHDIDSLVFELTNKCDAGCHYCPKEGNADIDICLVERILAENQRLKNPIRCIELGWDMGNPMLHVKIKEILTLMQGYGVNILTNGRSFLENAEGMDFNGMTVTFFLDHPCEADNDSAMGDCTYSGTLKSIAHMRVLKVNSNIYMRMNQSNYDKLPDMKRLADMFGATLTPTEIYPLGKATEKMWMDDSMKKQALADLESLGLNRSIHFSPALIGANCTYLRSRRMVIDAKGKLSFCHFMSPLPNACIADARNLSLLELIQRNNKARNGFLRNKEKRFPAWKKPRETSSPCSYCMHAFGVNAVW